MWEGTDTKRGTEFKKNPGTDIENEVPIQNEVPDSREIKVPIRYRTEKNAVLTIKIKKAETDRRQNF
jgi:hypothetical protein